MADDTRKLFPDINRSFILLTCDIDDLESCGSNAEFVKSFFKGFGIMFDNLSIVPKIGNYWDFDLSSLFDSYS